MNRNFTHLKFKKKFMLLTEQHLRWCYSCKSFKKAHQAPSQSIRPPKSYPNQGCSFCVAPWKRGTITTVVTLQSDNKVIE